MEYKEYLNKIVAEYAEDCNSEYLKVTYNISPFERWLISRCYYLENRKLKSGL